VFFGCGLVFGFFDVCNVVGFEACFYAFMLWRFYGAGFQLLGLTLVGVC